MDVDANKFWEDGYLLIKSVFSRDEVKNLKEKIIKAERNTKDLEYTSAQKPKPDLLSLDLFVDYLLDDRILSIAKKILGGDPVYFGDSSYAIRKKSHGIGEYHTDNADRSTNGSDWSGKYPIIRFAIYLQDHKKNGGGPLINKKSHKKIITNSRLRALNQEVFGWLNGNSTYVASEIGDIALWNLRTTHAGTGQYFKYFFNKPVSARLAKIVPKILYSKSIEDRYYITSTFGLEGNHLNNYLKYLKTRNYKIEQWKIDNHKSSDIQKIKDKGIKYYNMKKEVLNDLSKNLIKLRD